MGDVNTIACETNVVHCRLCADNATISWAAESWFSEIACLLERKKLRIQVLEDGNILSEDWRALCEPAGGRALRLLSQGRSWV